jgi:hypothetical protein
MHINLPPPRVIPARLEGLASYCNPLTGESKKTPVIEAGASPPPPPQLLKKVKARMFTDARIRKLNEKPVFILNISISKKI